MIIPTDWSTSDIHSWRIFDHPTPITESGTLGRTLDNLEKVGYPDPIILFPAPSDPSIEARVREIVAGRPLDIRIFTDTELKLVRSTLENYGFPTELLIAVNMNSYGSVRNMELLYAALNGFENVVMIDDDECIEEGYHGAALRYIGERVGDSEVLGKTGCVVDENGQKFYEGQASQVLVSWLKDFLFNENVRKQLEEPERLSPCIVAFSGNMVLNRKMFLRVPFDPYGTRVEDDDYVINARYTGLKFFFDQNLVLLHLPLERQGRYWTR